MAETGPPLPPADPPHEPWGSWGALIGSTTDPIFLLSRRRQLRYANRAWETLTGKTFDNLRGAFCLPRKKKGTGPLRMLLQALAPPPEVMDGLPATVRRPVPPHKLGPPWWEIVFVPLRDGGSLAGILGYIRAIAGPVEPGGTATLSEPLIALRQQAAAAASFDRLASDDLAMQRVEAQARLAAALKTPLWITGEPGTGKETLARIVHFNGVTREHTFLGIDCAGLQPFLIRNMLFGLAGQAGARLGTVYLKNPESLPRDLQGELLEWYEEHDDPPRVVVGSHNRPGPARDDRLMDEFTAAFNVFEIRVPPLRERAGDIARLTSELLRRDLSNGVLPPQLSHEALDCLSRHTWPGNVRELSEVLRSALKNSGGNRIEAAHLPLYLRTTGRSSPGKPVPKLDEILESVEARLIRQTLQRTKGNKSEAADLLGIPRARLLRRIETLRIPDTEWK